jgi:hypothetical protein
MKQAVVVIHGMGEQVPMDTLMGFSESVWVTDSDLIDADRPDSSTGAKRTTNAIWFKPDENSRSYELRRLATESLPGRGSTHFYEFYWAHLMEGTTFEHFRAWVKDLLWRSPRRVPQGLALAWTVLWIITIVAATCFILSLIPSEGKAWYWAVLGGVASLAVGGLVNTLLLKYFGDVARYVKAKPPNVARRQEIREKGVQLLESLMGIKPDGTVTPPEYDRIVVVAHSLGTIVAYDILTHTFARLNTRMTAAKDQPELVKMEGLIRQATGLEPQLAGAPQQQGVDLDAFQAQQAFCRAELNAQGNPWIVSDFVTLGSPLAHAEFLLTHDKAALRKAQEQRILPTCPPTLEYDATTEKRHMSYRTAAGADAPRIPHHAALFAFTRWTNIYSRHKAILWGDIISGPVGKQFDLAVNDRTFSGIRDIAVLPDPKDGKVGWKFWPPFFTHTKYWTLPQSWRVGAAVPHHIAELRKALKLKEM